MFYYLFPWSFLDVGFLIFCFCVSCQGVPSNVWWSLPPHSDVRVSHWKMLLKISHMNRCDLKPSELHYVVTASQLSLCISRPPNVTLCSSLADNFGEWEKCLEHLPTLYISLNSPFPFFPTYNYEKVKYTKQFPHIHYPGSIILNYVPICF